jgi:hypothetical protein
MTMRSQLSLMRQPKFFIPLALEEANKGTLQKGFPCQLVFPGPGVSELSTVRGNHTIN